MTTPSGRKRVVIVGAGFGGLAAAKVLGSRDEGSRVEVTVVDRLNYFLFQPLLYQVALAGLAATDVAYPIRAALHHRPNVSVLLGEVTGVDVDAHSVRLDDETTLGYDYLILAAGARTSYFGHDAWQKHAPGLKDLDDALEIRRRVLVALESAERATDPAERQRLLTFLVVGGGPTGVELAGAIADLSRDILAVDFKKLDRHAVRVVLVEMADRILTPFVPALSEKARVQLEDLRVEVRTGVRVEHVDARGAKVGGERIDAGTVLWGAGVRPSPLGAALGAPVDAAGRVVVAADCSVPGHPELFVIGDMARFTPAGAEAPLPGTSPVAMQQARSVARNILAEIDELPREPFRFVDKGFMATIGRARAVAQIGPVKLSGLIAWLAWVFLHLWYLVGFRNRVSVFMNWIWAYVISRHGARVITGRRPQPRAPAGES